MQVARNIETWESIVANIHPTQVPMTCVKFIEVGFVNGTEYRLDINSMRERNLDEEHVETQVTEFLTEYEEQIDTARCIIDVEAVASILEPYTQQILKEL